MGDRLQIHPTHPQARLLQRAAEALRRGSLLVVPSDAGYLLAWDIDARDAEERAQRLRGLDSKHPFTLLCMGLSDVSRLAKMDDLAFRTIKRLIPGPYTFILPVSSELPRRFKQAKRRVIGCRVPDHTVLQALVELHGAPLLSTSLDLPEETPDRHDAEDVADRILQRVDLMLDAGDTPPGPTSIVDLSDGEAVVARQGYRPLELQ